EANHDERGIVWPRELAPYDVHLVALQANRPEVSWPAEELYRDLQAAGLAVLYDDRDDTPGVKFNDADLLGLPLRVTISPRTLEKEVLELKLRVQSDSTLVPLSRAIEEVTGALQGSP
ncbi:MAG: His/Gly/Thr/Pro-type tRNA ligase C-terminal domain-containing protein, partial [Dehalococcoidia bacterium]